MGHTTDFFGQWKLDKPLSAADADFDAMAEETHRTMRGLVYGIMLGCIGWGLFLGTLYAICHRGH